MMFRRSEASVRLLICRESIQLPFCVPRRQFMELLLSVIAFRGTGRMTRVCLDECIRRALKLAYELRRDVNKG